MALCKAPPTPDVLLTGSWWSFTGTQLRLMRKSGYNLQQTQRVDFITMCSLIQFFQSIACSLEAFAFFPWITPRRNCPTCRWVFQSFCIARPCLCNGSSLLYCVLCQVIWNSTVVARWLWKSDILILTAHLVNGRRGRMWGGDCERRWGAPRNHFSYFILSFQPCAAISERWRYHFQLFKSANYTAVS